MIKAGHKSSQPDSINYVQAEQINVGFRSQNRHPSSESVYSDAEGQRTRSSLRDSEKESCLRLCGCVCVCVCIKIKCLSNIVRI